MVSEDATSLRPRACDFRRTHARRELRDLLLLTLESPRSLRMRRAIIRRQFDDYEAVKRQPARQFLQAHPALVGRRLGPAG